MDELVTKYNEGVADPSENILKMNENILDDCCDRGAR